MMNNKMKYPVLISAVIIAFVAATGIFLMPPLFKAPAADSVEPYALVLASRQKNEGLRFGTNVFENIILEAKSAYVFDLKTQAPLFALNENIQLPLASLAKLMIALIARENLSEGAVIEISKEAILPERDEGFKSGENWRALDLTDFMLIASSNDAASAIAGAIESKFSGGLNGNDSKEFSYVVPLMNKRSLDIGMTQTYYLNPTGLDVSKNIAGAYGSSRDIAKLVEYILMNEPSLLNATAEASISVFSFDGKPRSIDNTNQIINSVPGLIASKTGFTDLAGGNLMVVFDLGFNHPVITVILGSSYEGRFSDTLKLVEATFNYYKGIGP